MLPSPVPEISPVFSNVLVIFAIAGFVQWAKSTGKISSADAPGAAMAAGVVLGLLIGLAAGHGAPTLIYDALFGLVLGLVATGGYAVAAKVGGASASGAFAFRRKPPVR